MNRFLKLATLAFLLAGFLFAALAQAQPADPADSVIVQSKVVDTLSGPCNHANKLLVKVYVTNKDSLGILTLPFQVTTTAGDAYGIISRTNACTRPTLTTVAFNVTYPVGPNGGGQRLPTRVGNYSQWHSSSPDTFMGAFTLDNPGNDDGKLPPNAARTEWCELKFDSVRATVTGIFEIDSGKVLANTILFVDVGGNGQKVNFVKSVVNVNVPTDVRDIDKGRIPTVYSLAQNYPNPFNANTQISFALPKAGNARLDIYNVLGQKVSTLFDEYMNAGSKTVNWDGRDDGGVTVPSGVYFYQLVSQEFRQTKKMLLIK